MPTKHCPECTETNSCGKYHVYVVQLNGDAGEVVQFQQENATDFQSTALPQPHVKQRDLEAL